MSWHLASRLDATRRRRMSGYLSIGRWCFHLFSSITLFPCPAAARSTDGPSPESRSTLLSSIFEAGNARRLASISLVTSGTNYGERSDTEEFLQIFQRRPFVSASSAVTDLFSAIPRAIASSITAAYSIFETTGLFPIGYSDRDIKSLEEMLSRFYGLVNSVAPRSFRAPTGKRRHRRPPSDERLRDCSLSTSSP